VAGTFYPADPRDLTAAVDGMLDAAKGEGGLPTALVAPHAGYVYSGPVAASAYALLRGSEVRRVAILGPAHFVPLRACAVPASDRWETPLGEVEIDAELRAVTGVAVDEVPFEPEHSLEVQLPFLQRVLPTGFSVLPVAVGACSPVEVADVIGRLAPDVFVVVSTDLSHYHDDGTAKRLDRRTADAVLALDPEAIGPEDACGAFALGGLVEHALRRGLTAELVDLRTSADTAGDPRRVVGYGAFAFLGRV
jgi:AmmeMemoRadiSam system protein B